MTGPELEERVILLTQYHAARVERLKAETAARAALGVEQALAHKLWGGPFPEHAFGS